MTLISGLSTWLGRVPTVPAARQLRQDAWLQRLLIAYLGRLQAAERMHGEDAAAAPGFRFRLEVSRSGIPGAGRGVFLTAGSCAAGSVLTLYPGLVLDMAAFLDQLAATAHDDACAPSPPPFTLHNHYLLQLGRGGCCVLVDGRPYGLSAQRFTLAAEGWGAVNDSWLCLGGSRASPRCWPRLQAALGSMVNHGVGAAANAVFDLASLPPETPPELARLVPSVGSGRAGAAGAPRWVPLLRACRNISAPAELLVDYGANPVSLGFDA